MLSPAKPTKQRNGAVTRSREKTKKNTNKKNSPIATTASTRVRWDRCLVRLREIPTGDRSGNSRNSGNTPFRDSDNPNEPKRKLSIVKKDDVAAKLFSDATDDDDEDEWDEDDSDSDSDIFEKTGFSQSLPSELHVFEGDLPCLIAPTVAEEPDNDLTAGVHGLIVDDPDALQYPVVDISRHERDPYGNAKKASSALVRRAFDHSVCHLPLGTLVYASPGYMQGVDSFEDLLADMGLKSVIAVAKFKWYKLAVLLVHAAEREAEREKEGRKYWDTQLRKMVRAELDDSCHALSFSDIVQKDCTVFVHLPGRLAGIIERELGHITIMEFANDPMFDNAMTVVSEWEKTSQNVIYSHSSMEATGDQKGAQVDGQENGHEQKHTVTRPRDEDGDMERVKRRKM
jgi:hypothetical protein